MTAAAGRAGEDGVEGRVVLQAAAGNDGRHDPGAEVVGYEEPAVEAIDPGARRPGGARASVRACARRGCRRARPRSPWSPPPGRSASQPVSGRWRRKRSTLVVPALAWGGKGLATTSRRRRRALGSAGTSGGTLTASPARPSVMSSRARASSSASSSSAASCASRRELGLGPARRRPLPGATEEADHALPLTGREETGEPQDQREEQHRGDLREGRHARAHRTACRR